MLEYLKLNKFIKAGISAITLCAVFLLPNFVIAADFGMSYGDAIGLGTGDPRIIAVGIIRVALTFVGIIAVALIMYSGWLWMTSEGNEAKVDQAKKTLKNAVIGLIIIMSAFAIVTFIFNKLTEIYGGGTEAVSEPPGPDWGLGALGSCTVESVYPEPYQEEVPRNTGIIVTFKEEVDPATICDDAGGNDDGDCDLGEYIIPEHVRIFKTTAGDGCPLPCAGNILEVNVATNDNKTFIFSPVNYLGSPSEYIWHSVYLSNDIRKLADGAGVFDTCSTDYFQWEFEVSNKVDLTPPQVKEEGVFPAPDNESDDIGTASVAVRAEGSITVNSQPEAYAQASLVSANKNPIAGAWNDVAVVVDEHSQGDGILTVTILPDGLTAQLNKGATLLGSAIFTGDTVDFSNYFSLQVLGDGSYNAGNSWNINVTAEAQADTLTIGGITYVFVSGVPVGNQIQIGAATAATASNIAAVLAGHPDVTAAAALNVVSITAKVAGLSGNNIVLTISASGLTLNPDSGHLEGGQDIEVTTTVNGKKDKPRNATIQINFNEAINPITVSGYASDVENYIAVKCISMTNDAGVDVACDTLLEPAAFFNCGGDICLNGEFVVSNQYRTVEFVSNKLCGVNGCGEKIYCLPENSRLKVELVAADLEPCATDNDCASKSPHNICAGMAGFVHCKKPVSLIYPEMGKNHPKAAAPVNGIVDMALNSFDGDRSGYSDGPVKFHSDNPKIYSLNPDCQSDFEKIINTIIDKRIETDLFLGDITGSFCSNCRCADQSSAQCIDRMTTAMQNLGFSGALYDYGGGLFIFDENENEGFWGPCRIDTVRSNNCGAKRIPFYVCANGDNYEWSFFISDQIDLSPPRIDATKQDRGSGAKDLRHGDSDADLSNPILINFSKVMMSSSLSTGSTVIFNGNDYVAHQLINLWNFTGQPTGYWTTNNNIDDDPLDGEPDWTQVQINHSSFIDSTSYRAQAGSGIKDIYQNCFKPSSGSGCVGAPSCCGGVPDAGDSCP